MYELEATANVLLVSGQGKSSQGKSSIEQQASGFPPETRESPEAFLIARLRHVVPRREPT